MKVKQYHCYSAILMPKITTDLKDKAKKLIGKRLIFEVCWKIDNHSTKRYNGQWAMYCKGVGWFPLEDLKNIKEVEE